MTQWNDMAPSRLRNWANAIERRADCQSATDPYVLRDLAAAWEADRAALERARALVPLVRLYIEYLESEQGYEENGTMAWRSWQEIIAEAENAIAAALGSGGAA